MCNRCDSIVGAEYTRYRGTLRGRQREKESQVDLIWIIVIVIIVLLVLGYFGRGRFMR